MLDKSSARALVLALLPMAVPDVFAQSNVAVSGDINVVLSEVEGRTTSGESFSITKLDSVASHLRFRESETLGGGLSAGVFLTLGFRADTGIGTVCGRECWLGLFGQFGTLKMGRLLTIYDDVSLPWYYIDAGGSHNPAALWANCGRGGDAGNGCLDDFVNYAIRYDTPEARGYKASISVIAPGRSSTGPARPARLLVVGVEHRSGLLYSGIAVLKQADVRGPGTDDRALTASLNLKSVVNVGLGFEHLVYSIPFGGAIRRNYLGLMLNKAMGPHSLWVNYGIAGRGYGNAPAGSTVNEISNLRDSGASMESVGYQYKFSRSMQIYMFLNMIRNQGQAIYCFDTTAMRQLGAGRTLSAFAVGMRKRF